METNDENENIELKLGDIEKYSRKQTKSKKIKNKRSKGSCFILIIILLIFVILCIIFIIFNNILKNEREYYENIIGELNETKKILIKNNSILENESHYYQNLSNYLNKVIEEKEKLFKEIDFTSEKVFKIVAISYGSSQYAKSLEYNGKSALEIAKVDKFYGYTPKDIDEDFKRKNKYILEKGRGNGYWLWKPYFLYKTLKEKLNYGDYLIYSDAAIMYVDLAQKLVDFLNEKNLEMYLHRLPHLEKYYTKRDAFILLGVDQPFYTETGQFNAAFQIYKKTKFTEFFLSEYLYYAQDKRIITDDPNELGYNNYEGFRDHRHDQSILSLLTKKYGQVNANKTNLNLTLIKQYREVMPTIFCHYRQRGIDSYEGLKNLCKNVRGNIS